MFQNMGFVRKEGMMKIVIGKRVGTIFLVLICLVLVLGMVGCSGTASTTATTAASGDQPQYGGTLRIVMAFQLSNIGYTPTLSGAMSYPTDPVYEGLIWGNIKTGEMVPWLAESFQKDPAGKFITIKLRKGIKFHDDTNCDAQAIKDYLTLKMSKQKGWLLNVQSIDVVDSLTLKFNTSSIDINTMVQLGESISSPTWLAKGEDAVAMHPVGTGPYKFSDYKQNAYLKYVRFDDYWGGKPYLDGVDIILVPDTQTQISTLLAGQAEIVYSVPFQDTERVKAAGFNFSTINAVYQGFAPDSANPKSILANPKLVQAVNYAINKTNIAGSLGYGYMHAADSVIPPDVAGYKAGSGYDPEKAKKLMAEAGYPNGFDTTLITCMMANSDAMVAVQSDLAKVNIKAKIDLADMGRWFGARIQGWENGLIFVYGIYGQPFTYYFNRTWAKSQPDRYISAARPAGFDDNLAKLITQDDNASKATLQTLAQSMEDSGMYVPFITQGQVCAISPKVHDYGIFNDSMTLAGWFKYKTWMSK
jgi:peptide/nickel transport system substrate-binding protein